jgi:hypothetical protein
MGLPFEEYEALVHEQMAAIVEAELALDPGRAARYGPLLARSLVAPRVIGCQPAVPERDPSPAAMTPMWLVCEVRRAAGPGQFIAYDPERQCFGLGSWEGRTAWYLGDGGSLLDLVAELADQAA